MAKISIDSIDGYADMTAEEKVAYFENFEYEDNLKAIDSLKGEVERLKASGSKANSECAEWKRKFRDTQDAETRAKEELAEANARAEQEREQAIAEIKAERDALLHEKELTKYAIHYKDMGMPEDLAMETAQALLEKDMTKVFANEKSYQATYKQSVEQALIQQTPTISAGKIPTKEDAEKTEMDKLRHYAGLI